MNAPPYSSPTTTTNHPPAVMDYLPFMERDDSDLLSLVLAHRSEQEQRLSSVSSDQVESVLTRSFHNLESLPFLLSSAATSYLEPMAEQAHRLTTSHFGNNITLFTPLYLANYCENTCRYCGFSRQNKIPRAKLTESDIKAELKRIRSTGLREILLLTGESSVQSDVDYLVFAVKLARQWFSTIGIEVAPLNTDEYARLHQAGADFVSVYQETYDLSQYDAMHPAGPKRCFSYRFSSQERALRGGMRGVSFGVLLGLSDFRLDVASMLTHAFLLWRRYPQAEIAFSFPRLRPPYQTDLQHLSPVTERDLLQAMLTCRLLFPFAGITLSTRERPLFRDHVMGMAATKLSAGVQMEIKSADHDLEGQGQFDISDTRSVEEMRRAIVGRGLQPVFSDYIDVQRDCSCPEDSSRRSHLQ